MALNIRNKETERLATILAKMSGETKTEAVTRALRDRIARVRQERTGRGLAEELEEIAAHCARLPVRDDRAVDDRLPFDHRGLPR